jgi:hypothetical protein
MARLAGFEPATSASAGLRSIQLSYRRIYTPFNQRPHPNGTLRMKNTRKAVLQISYPIKDYYNSNSTSMK